MKLGILYKDGKIVSHRSIIKVLLNPILRYFGYHIVTIVTDDRTCIVKITLNKTFKSTYIKWSLDCVDYDTIIKKRILY